MPSRVPSAPRMSCTCTQEYTRCTTCGRVLHDPLECPRGKGVVEVLHWRAVRMTEGGERRRTREATTTAFCNVSCLGAKSMRALLLRLPKA